MSENENQTNLEPNEDVNIKTAENSNAGEAQNAINVDELKKETTETVKQFKDTIKSVNLKEDTEATKGFVKEFIKDPLATIKSIASNPTPFIKTAILLIIVWAAASALNNLTIWSLGFKYLFRNMLDSMLSFIKGGVAPLLAMLILSGIVFVKDKKKTNSLIGVMTTLIVAQIPRIFAEVVSILTILGRNVNMITSPITKFCSVLSIILTYFAVKYLLDKEEDNSFIKEYVIIYVIYCIASIFTRFFGIFI